MSETRSLEQHVRALAIEHHANDAPRTLIAAGAGELPPTRAERRVAAT